MHVWNKQRLYLDYVSVLVNMYKSIYIVELTSLVYSFSDHSLALRISQSLKAVIILSRLEIDVFSG